MKTPEIQITIPEWINHELWEEFKEHRKLLGKNKELNHLSTKRILNKLLKFKKQGYNPDTILDTAIENGWTSVFVTREMEQSKNKTRGGWAGLDPDHQIQQATEDFLKGEPCPKQLN